MYSSAVIACFSALLCQLRHSAQCFERAVTSTRCPVPQQIAEHTPKSEVKPRRIHVPSVEISTSSGFHDPCSSLAARAAAVALFRLPLATVQADRCTRLFHAFHLQQWRPWRLGLLKQALRSSCQRADEFHRIQSEWKRARPPLLL